jgi:hypothetical protein
VSGVPCSAPDRARRLALLAALALAVTVAALLAASCAEETTGVRVPNQPPSVRITRGPIEDSLHIYRVTFHWAAQDPDGHVEGYAYAVDDTTDPDALELTTERSAALRFTADDFFDTVIEVEQGIPIELYRYGRHHTFHVRAVDDGGAWSEYASAAFFAVTVAPQSEIVNPIPTAVATVGPTFEVTWRGDDLDGTAPPDSFTYRLVAVPPESLLVIPPERLDCPACGPPWSPFEATTLARFASIQVGTYLFGVRAMDEAGAVEPELRAGHNVARLRVSEEPGRPRVTFSGPGKTITLPSGNEVEKTFDLISGRPAALGWEADASHYGARISGFAYGIDLESIAPNDPGWVPTPNPGTAVTFDNPPGVEEVEHGFYLRVEDSIGQQIVVDVILRVGPPDFERDILYVDDIGGDRIGSPSNPSDAESDSLIQEVLLAEARRRGLTIDQYEVQDILGHIDEEAPKLSILRRHKLLVWSVGSTSSVLFQAMDPERGFPLSEYLTLGGQLLLTGKRALSRTKFTSIEEYFGFSSEEFGYQFFHIESEFVGGQIVAGEFLRPRGDLTSQRIDGMDGGRTTPEAAAEGWPELLVARPPYTSPLLGIPLVEGMTRGYEQGPRPGDLDTLYTFITNGSRVEPFPVPSRLDSAPCAFRYEGPDHGKVMVWSFPIFWWSDGAIDSLGTRAIEWFFDETP